MDENAGVTDRTRTLSPWPVFVALGLPIAELGIVFDVFPVAVGGLLLFAGSISGLLAETNYASTPWRAVGVCGALLTVAGGLVVLGTTYGTRGRAVVVAGALLLVGAAAGELLGGEDPLI